MENSEFLIYQSEDGTTKIEVRMVDETVWLTLNQLAELFQRDKSVISRHLKNVLKEGELTSDSVVANFATTAADGKTYKVAYYNLDMIISVGYRVNSHRGTQFRIMISSPSTSAKFWNTLDALASSWLMKWPKNNSSSSKFSNRK